MRSPSKHRKRSAIGLDVGDHAVKCVQLENYRGDLRVREICCVEVEAGPAGPSGQRERVLEAAQRALRAGDFHGRDCLSSLRLFETTTRHVRIPADEVNRAEDVLVRELQEGELAPGSSLQFQKVTELMDRGQRQCEFLCSIADPRVVREHLDLLSALRLRPQAIDLESCAQIRPFTREGDDDEGSIRLIIDLGCRCSRLILVKASSPIQMRTVPVGGADLQKTLKQRLQLDFQALRDLAEANRQDSSADLGDLKVAISGTLSQHLDQIVNRVFECSRYAATLFGGQKVETFRVLGGAAALPGVVEYLARNLNMTVEEADPFRAIGLELPLTSRSVTPGSFATAVGLAMRGMAA